MKIDISVKPGSSTKNKTGGWRTYIPKTNFDTCIGCGTCERVCPEDCISMTTVGSKKKPVTDYDFCKGCGVCASECPVKAITMKLDKK